ncbi:dethiobiotin synthase [Mycobacterium sp. CBMA 234]|uniref:dethiobiotin synthase n=1 Tax=Mycolicibacterium sp. CBMA 234 TaxID=1918495 RepID=UPI001391F297|nr:dethiobiotin synthase [Mycolicibacterium sp. CBMA 234]MUL63613.1 dethiobiotin synthase [Mycolicibacterium sp. CBMA 234]
MTVLLVAGTDTGVGKTIATAALACAAHQAGLHVTVCKAVQTGIAPAAGHGDDDLAEVARLAGITSLVPGWRYPEPLAPVAAAELAGMALPTRAELLALIRNVDRSGQLTLVEGAGGLLVELGADGTTLRDLAVELGAAVLVVVAPGLGTLNHTGLTVESLAAHGIPCAGLVVGSWPQDPGLAETSNRVALARIAAVRALLPSGAGQLSPEEFAAVSAEAFDVQWVSSLVG